MSDEILIQYSKGGLDEAGRAAVVTWLEADPAHLAHYADLQLAGTFDGMDLPELSAEDAVERLAVVGWPGSDAKTPRMTLRWPDIVSRVAAILLVPLLVAGVWVISRQHARIDRLVAESKVERIAPIQEDASSTYVVNPGVKGDIVLPDGSRVRLNSASTLRCPDRFAPDSRVVELSGEGFFEVESNPDWPMYVRTPQGVTVKVTGTKFNVCAYENESALRLTLVEGSVTVIHEASAQQYAVRPNEEMVFFAAEKVKPVRHAVDVQPAIVWKDGILHFENTPMDEVVRRLERWYGVSINVSEPSLLQMNFTASFESESLSQVLQLLKITSRIDYRIQGRQVTLSRR